MKTKMPIMETQVLTANKRCYLGKNIVSKIAMGTKEDYVTYRIGFMIKNKDKDEKIEWIDEPMKSFDKAKAIFDEMERIPLLALDFIIQNLLHYQERYMELICENASILSELECAKDEDNLKEIVTNIIKESNERY